VQNRQLQTGIGKNRYAKLQAEWQKQLVLLEELKAKPSDLKRDKKVKRSILYYNHAEGCSNKDNHTTLKKFYDESEASAKMRDTARKSTP
jgi:hypothetical protein